MPKLSDNTQPERFLRLAEVLARTGLGRSTLYVMMADGRFPKPVAISEYRVAWREVEVRAWQAQRVALRDAPSRRGKRRPPRDAAQTSP